MIVDIQVKAERSLGNWYAAVSGRRDGFALFNPIPPPSNLG
jgi:hypothetical protein